MKMVFTALFCLAAARSLRPGSVDSVGKSVMKGIALLILAALAYLLSGCLNVSGELAYETQRGNVVTVRSDGKNVVVGATLKSPYTARPAPDK